MPDGNSAESASKSLDEPAPSASTAGTDAPIAHASTGNQPQRRPLWMWIAGGVLLLLALYEAIPRAITAFRTESTDDAYVNGHVTFVAPRVPGQVVRVLVDDNYRVRKGTLLGGTSRAGCRANPRRLYHRQLRLALDLLSERACGPVGLFHVPRAGSRSGISTS
jgi:Biotin-lipoyl like